jgi:hypothetical protein
MNNKAKNLLIVILIVIILSVVVLLTSINNWFIIPIISIGIILSIFIIVKKGYNIDTGLPFIEEPVKEKKKEVTKLESVASSLYLDMQKYFMNLEYDKLKEILSDNLYNQFEKEMHTLENNNKRAIRENIEIIDMAILGDNKVSIGVLEDKYTKSLNSTYKRKNVRYESYYEITINENKIEDLRLIYSHSKKD